MVLRILWLGVVEVFEGILHIAQHGEVDLADFIVPIEVEAKVAGPVPVVGKFLVLLEDVHEVVDVLFALVLIYKIFNTKGKRDIMPSMGPKTRHNLVLPVALCVQSFLEQLLGEEPGFRKSVNASPDFDVNVAVLFDFRGQVLLPHDVVRKVANLEAHVLVA